MRIVAIDSEAARQGLTLGQTVSDGRAQIPSLNVREIDHSMLVSAFTDFADWHSYASPMVSVLGDAAPYGDLVLDITGVSHLFGGEAQMLEKITSRLTALGFAVTGAIAPTIGAAWAISHFGRQGVLAGRAEDALADLPVAALRLEDAQVSSLIQVGLKKIGQLLSRERKGLNARFGASLLLRLDQALGRIEERMTPRLPLAERFVEHRFADPIGLMDDVLMCAQDLAVSLSVKLEAEGLGAKSFHLFLYRVDHKVMSFSVNAGRATRDAGHISRLFANRAERLGGEYDAGFGIDMIRLAASSVSEVDPTQIGAFDADDGAKSLDKLYDRIASRLGQLAVLRPKLVNTHLPERAVELEPVLAATGDDPIALLPVMAPRPLRLLPQPEPISVSLAEVPDGPPPNMVWRRVSYRFVKTSGPERIGAEWWRLEARLKLNGHAMGPASAEANNRSVYREGELARDYYVAEDDGGRRFWIFRDGLFGVSNPKWFLHGFFA